MKTFLIAFVMVVFLAGCATTTAQQSAYTMYTVQEAVVLDVRPVTLQGSGNGEAVGTIVGALLGYSIAGDRTSKRTIGILAGGTAGNRIGASTDTQSGISLTLRLEHGETVNIVQPAQRHLIFYPNQRVQLIGNNQGVQVVPHH